MIKDRTEELRDSVRRAYSKAAEKPRDEHPFPIGRQFAESLGYPHELLDTLPDVAMDGFAGVSNVSIFADISAGASVLDLGCGAGLDSLIAAGRVGPNGKVIGVDFSQSMLSRARRAKVESGTNNVEFYAGDAESLPIEDGAIDVALVNGIFNLNPDREAIFSELARVLRPGGSVYAAELILREPLPQEARDNQANWFA